jgi:hypothetical protein
MEKIIQQKLGGERALFNKKDLILKDVYFDFGESCLKECENIEVYNTIFSWKYPMWYSTNIKCENVRLLETARSGIWYTSNISIINSTIDAPKTFRRSSNIKLENVSMVNASETLWNCKDINIKNVTAKGDYFGMNSENIVIDRLNLTGNYCFDGCSNIRIKNSSLMAKDSFWNCDDVIVEDSTIIGEYLGWNSSNITFINCTIQSLQGFCYMKNVKLVNCKLINTTLSFEYSSVDADIVSNIDSIKNPISGNIKAKHVDEVIIDENKIEGSNCKIEQDN